MNKKPERFLFTAVALAKLTCERSGREHRSGRVWAYDTREPGLAFCVTEGGARAFYLCLRVNGRFKRLLLGRPLDAKLRPGMSTPEMLTVEQARKLATATSRDIREGADPIARRAAARAAAAGTPTFQHLWESYKIDHLDRCRARTRREFVRLYTAHLKAWDRKPLAGISEIDVEMLKTRVGAKSVHIANKLLAMLSAMFRSRGHLFGLPKRFTPTADVKKYKEHARDRVLSPEELAAVIQAIRADDNDIARDYFLMLLYTGARRDNVRTIRWDDVSLQRKTWKIAGETTKNGNPLVVNLVAEAMEILTRREETNPPDSPYVFPGRRPTPDQVDKARQLRAAGKSTHAIGRDLDITQSTICKMLDPGMMAGAAAAQKTADEKKAGQLLGMAG